MSVLHRLIAGRRPAHADALAAKAEWSGTASDRARAEFTAHAAAGRHARALGVVRAALAAAPDDPELLYARGSILFEWRRLTEARGDLLRASAAGIAQLELFAQLGWTNLWMGALDEAERWMRRAIKADDGNWQTHFGLGNVLRGQRRIDEAIASFEAALVHAPDNAECLTQLFACQYDAHRTDEALAAARRAVDAHPDHVAALTNLAAALSAQDQFVEANAVYDRIATIDVVRNGAQPMPLGKGFPLSEAGRVAEALAFYAQELPHRPEPDAHVQYAFALLKSGRLREGFVHYEYRFMIEPLIAQRPRFGRPIWSGQALPGKTILVLGEQGFGDTIQFMRYLSLLQAQGARVLVFLRRPMRGLVERVDGVDQVCEPDVPLPGFDYWIPLMSLPHVFGTDLDTVPSNVPYVHASTDRVAQWRSRVAGGDHLKVGIVWAGDPAGGRGQQKSLPLAMFGPMAAVPGVRLYSLQKGAAATEVERAPAGMALTDLSPDIEDFGDTAAIIASLDLVISVCTAVAHLAGAMGKPVWTLIAEPADWRWLENREDTPWYPTMRLFRQPRQGDWSCLARATHELEIVARDRGRLRAETDRGALPAIAPLTVRVPPPAIGNANMCDVAEARHGIFQFRAGLGPTERSLAWYGEYLEPHLALLRRAMIPGETVLEAGSGFGAHSVFLLSAVGPSGHAFLCESRPDLCTLLQTNLAANGVSGFTMIHSSLLGDPSSASGHADDDTHATIDQLDFARLDWIKIGDGQNAPAILAGASNTLWTLRPRLFVAVPDETALHRVAGLLRDFGYHCGRVDTPLFDPDNFNRRTDDIFGGAVAHAVVAIPEESSAGAFPAGLIALE